jgi:conjugal transfer pilus assembly protein TraD
VKLPFSPSPSSRAVERFADTDQTVIAASGLCLLGLTAVAQGRHYPESYLAVAGIAMLVLAAIEALRTIEAWNFRARLSESRVLVMKADEVLAKQRAKPGHVWMGYAFEWEQHHAELLHYFSSLKSEDYAAPPFWRALRRRVLGVNDGRVGDFHYLQAFGEEKDLWVPEDALKGHTMVLGTTGAGKTRLFELRMVQAIAADHAVIIIDPKGDKDLRDRAYAEAKRRGRPNDFIFFSPSNHFRNVSAAINPLGSYDRLTQIADRIKGLIPGGGNSEAFRSFAWKAIYTVSGALERSHQPITLMSLRRHIQGDLEPLVISTFEECFRSMATAFPELRTWESEVRQRQGRGLTSPSKTLDTVSSIRAMALATYYAEVARRYREDPMLTALSASIQHDPVHYSKTIANLIPLLEQLTSGPLAELLSPPPNDHSRSMTTFTFAEMIARRAIVYIALDALADTTIAGAIGSLFLADLRSVAGQRANTTSQQHLLPVTVLVDEVSEVMNEAMLQLLNKSRSAGFQITFATQTNADIEERMQSAAAAAVAMGNANTFVALRLKDCDTAEMVVKKFGRTYVEASARSSATGTVASDNADFTASVGRSVQRREADRITAAALDQLPAFEYFMQLPGGRQFKGRYPLIPISDGERWPEKPPTAYGLVEPDGPVRLAELPSEIADVPSPPEPPPPPSLNPAALEAFPVVERVS